MKLQTRIRESICILLICVCTNFALGETPSFGEADTPETSRPVGAEWVAYRFHVDAGFRWQQGTARELVYTGNLLLSELTWDIKDLLYAGFTARALLGQRWVLQASYWEGMTEGRGGMTDYDYFIPFIWTDFSDGVVDINRAYMLDFHAAWTFWQLPKLQTQVLGGYRELHWDWSQYGGNFIYSVNGFRDFRGSFPADQNGINYEQTFQIPYIGLSIRKKWPGVSLQGYVHYSPIARAEGLDEHVLRNLFFEDTFNNVKYYAAGVSVAYPVGNRWFISGAWDWHHIPETRGNVLIIDALDGSEERIKDSAGIANAAWNLSMSVGMRF